MRSSRCMFSTAAALRRVFITPIEQSQVQFSRQTSPSKFASYPGPTATRLPLPQRRFYAEKSRYPRNDEITSWSVILVGEDGKLGESQSTRDILSSIDRRKQSLVVVEPGRPGALPICRIVDNAAVREAEKARNKVSKNPASILKKVELNWALAPNDLEHRMNKVKQFLEKGNRVEIILAPKRKRDAKRLSSEEEAEALIENIWQAVRAVDGVKESKPREGKLLENLTISLEAKKVPKSK